MIDVRKLDLFLAIVLVLFLLVVAGCTPPQPGSELPQRTGGDVDRITPTPAGSFETSQPGFANLVEQLRQTGALVDPVEEIESSFIPVTGRIINVDGNRVEVYEFPSEAARKATSDTISEDGFAIGNTMISWIDRPNFWIKENLLVLYVGSDGTLIERLGGILGDSITNPVLPVPNHPEAVVAAMRSLRQAVGVKMEEIEVIGFEYVQWPNACLGIQAPNMMCAEVITPGYRVVLGAAGKTYTFHTDESGAQVRQAK